MNDWPEYVSHKVVRAAKIVGITDTGVIMVDPFDGNNAVPFEPTEPGMSKRANVGDWAMLYPDGFKSISPAKAFEEGYSPHHDLS
jgi:hypothetical protein